MPEIIPVRHPIVLLTWTIIPFNPEKVNHFVYFDYYPPLTSTHYRNFFYNISNTVPPMRTFISPVLF